MIRIHVSAVCRVRDGFTGKILEGSRLQCDLDGARCRPTAKPGGYLVLTDLPAGPHRLSLRCPGYQEEWVEFSAGRDTQEQDVTMKPGRGYPLQRDMIRLTLTVTEGGAPAAGRILWLAAPGQTELKIAQTKAEAGSASLRLFAKGAAAPAVPGTYLIADGKNSEIVLLRALEEEMGELLAPLARPHSRSRSLLPAQRYHTDGEGVLTAAFREPCAVEVCGPEGELLAGLELTQGENHYTIQL